MPTQLIEYGSLHRKNTPIRIVGRMGARENIKRLLEIAVIGERATIAGEQRLVAGVGDGGLFKHGDRLAALPGGAQRLAISQRGVGILGIGAIALAVKLRRAPRIGFGVGLVSAFDVSDPVISDMVWQPPSPAANIAVTAADPRRRARLDC
jgi:hypothetical protein